MCLAVPGEIVELDPVRPELATVDVQGVRRVVNTGLVDDITPGDWVLIHVGFAMAKIDEAEAQATLDLLRSAGTTYSDELDALRDSEIS
jgi:hydrogenase expression/formation protein HypC